MIRKLLNRDIDRVADIWLKTNLKAHYFISNQYWNRSMNIRSKVVDEAFQLVHHVSFILCYTIL